MYVSIFTIKGHTILLNFSIGYTFTKLVTYKPETTEFAAKFLFFFT